MGFPTASKVCRSCCAGLGWRLPKKAELSEKRQKSQQYPPGQLLTFLNSLSTESDSVAWITAFREGLLQLLADVDKVAVAVNFECDILTPGASGYDVQVQQFVDTAQRASQEVAMNESQQSLTRSQSIIQALRLRGFTEDLYHQPIAFEYYLKGVEYLGVVVLWREQSKTAISKETIELLTRLEPFITFALSDLVARHQLAKPQERLFNAAMVAMRNEGKLTEQERRVVILQVTGHTYQQIADKLEISVETVRKHISNVYRKTGTSSSVELFAKYFTPRLSQ
ncbi:MAG: response regulator [Chlorobi bacterium OLB7]|nr:MAG: response regulator [Chlorobi bacterium OLB7]